MKTRLYAIIGEHGSKVRQTLRVIGTKTRAANDPSVFTNMVEIFWLKEPTRAFLGNIQVLRNQEVPPTGLGKYDASVETVVGGQAKYDMITCW